MPIFPEGHIIPTGGRTLGEGKPGVAYLAVTARVPVIPVYLWGTPENNKFVSRSACLAFSDSRRAAGGSRSFNTTGKPTATAWKKPPAKLMDAIRALRDQVQPPSAEVLSDGQRLSTVLSAYPAVALPATDPVALGNAGGLSGSRLWRFSSGLGALVLRAWPVDGPTPVVLEQIHRWLADVAELGIIPVPIRRLDGRTLAMHAGRFWELTPWMPGARCRSRSVTPRLPRRDGGAGFVPPST